jgi:hypothetical protein
MRRYLARMYVVAIMTTAGSGTVEATLSDPGFESPPAGPAFGHHLFNPNSPTAGQSPWTFVGSAGVSQPGWQSLSFSAPEGEQVGFLQNGDGTLGGGSFSSGLRQTVTGLAPSASYRIEFWSAMPENARSIEPTRVHVYADGVELASVLPGTSFELFTTGAFTAPASGSAVLTFIGERPNQTFDQALSLIDGVAVTTVPEPVSILGALACFTAAFTGRVRRRKRAQGC